MRWDGRNEAGAKCVAKSVGFWAGAARRPLRLGGSRAKWRPVRPLKRMPKILRKPAVKSKPGAARLGALPEWDLSALYSGLDDPAIKRDLDRTDADCVAFEEAYKGKLAEVAAPAQGGAALGEAVRRYEAISDRMGRLGSYAVLIHED